MADCDQVQANLTAWVDGQLGARERTQVDGHLAGCGACRDRALRERDVRGLIEARRAHLTTASAPAALRARLEAVARGRTRPGTWVRMPIAVAATLLLALSGITLHMATGRSTTVLAAQLAADHLKCHKFEHDRGELSAARVRERLLAHHGFDARVPDGRPDLHLRLIGVRRCLTGTGTNAHMLYRFGDRPISLYFVGHRADERETIEVLGRQAHVWTGHNGTYVLVADPDVDGLAEVLAFMEAGTR
jgi:anti-sigma factor RsiW